eukprot:1091251-Prorocentrum_minimum.AAC.1
MHHSNVCGGPCQRESGVWEAWERVVPFLRLRSTRRVTRRASGIRDGAALKSSLTARLVRIG